MGHSARSPRSCPTDAHPNTSGSSRRWVPYCPTAGSGRCCQSFCRSVSRRLWKPPGSEHFVSAPGWSGKPSQGWGPSRQSRRNPLRSPLTEVMCGRLVSTRGARSRFCVAVSFSQNRGLPEFFGVYVMMVTIDNSMECHVFDSTFPRVSQVAVDAEGSLSILVFIVRVVEQLCGTRVLLHCVNTARNAGGKP
jgi:hypothetical protein